MQFTNFGELLFEAENKNPLAQFELGIHYEDAAGRVEDHNEAGKKTYDALRLNALSYYLRAANQEHRDAQFYLGCYLTRGAYDLRKKAKVGEPLTWFRKAARQGCVRSMVQLGFLLQNIADKKPEGSLKKRYQNEAFRWVKLAADTGHQPAYGDLARMYERGIGGQSHQALAFSWYAESINHEADPKNLQWDFKAVSKIVMDSVWDLKTDSVKFSDGTKLQGPTEPQLKVLMNAQRYAR